MSFGGGLVKLMMEFIGSLERRRWEKEVMDGGLYISKKSRRGVNED